MVQVIRSPESYSGRGAASAATAGLSAPGVTAPTSTAIAARYARSSALLFQSVIDTTPISLSAW